MYQEVLKMDHEYCCWIDQVEEQQSHLKLKEILVMAEDAERTPEPKSGKQYDSRTYDKTHQKARGGKALRRNASIERTRQKTQDARTESSQLNHSLEGRKPLAEETSPEVDGACAVTDDVFARAWGGEFGRELCEVAETRGEPTMSILKEKQAWDHLTERPRLVLAEIGAHTGARMCSTMQELAGDEKKCHKARRHRQPPDRSNSQQTACENTGTKETTTPLAQSECGSYCTPAQTGTTFGRTHKNRQNDKKRRRLQQEYKGALVLVRVQIGLGGDTHGNGRINVQHGILISCLKASESYV